MSNQSNFESIGDADLDGVSGGRGHRVASRVVNYAGYNYNYGIAGATVPAIVPSYSYAPAPVAYPTYATSYPGYGMRLGTAI